MYLIMLDSIRHVLLDVRQKTLVKKERRRFVPRVPQAHTRRHCERGDGDGARRAMSDPPRRLRRACGAPSGRPPPGGGPAGAGSRRRRLMRPGPERDLGLVGSGPLVQDHQHLFGFLGVVAEELHGAWASSKGKRWVMSWATPAVRATPHRLYRLGEQAGVVARTEDVEFLPASEVEDGEGDIVQRYTDNHDGARGSDDVGGLADEGRDTGSFNHHRRAVTGSPAFDRPFDRFVRHVDDGGRHPGGWPARGGSRACLPPSPQRRGQRHRS